MGKQYTVGGMSITTSAPATTSVECASTSLQSNAVVIGNESGSIYEQSLSLAGFSPVANIRSKSLATLFGLVGLNGQCVGSGQAVTQVDLFARRLTDCQTSLGGSPHLRDRVTTGLLRLDSLEASRAQDATLGLILDALTDGTNAPVARTDGVALPSTLVAQQFTLGVCSIGGVEIPEIESISLAFNVSITDKTPALAQIWPDTVGVLQVKPVLTLTGRDLAKITNSHIAAGVISASHANTKIQLVKRANASSFVAAGTAEHILITMAGVAVPEDLQSASANQRGTNSIRLIGYYDGTNAPVVINAASTYDSTPG